MLQALKRNAAFFGAMARTLPAISRLKPEQRTLVADRIEKSVDRHGNRIALIDANTVLTYKDMEERANRYANWALGEGIGRGSVVALMMENCPDYIMAWFGLLKTGATVSLINTNLIGAPLAHSINTCDCTHLVIGGECEAAVFAISASLEKTPDVWSLGKGAKDLGAALADTHTTRPPATLREGMTGLDGAFYIYTSGTTGNPKAAIISNSRWLMAAQSFASISNNKPKDRMYIVLPLYHSTGGMAAAGSVLLSGSAMFVKRKFSATEFWTDCRAYNLSRFQYVGELCRYLLNSPPHPDEKKHNVKLAVGNGLRPDVWPEFEERFNIPRVLEFYGATEGNISLFNLDGKQGAIGHIPNYMRSKFPARIVKFDVENEVPIRGEDGFCIECDIDESGEILGQIKQGDALSRVDGYTDKKASEAKILRDVFEKGDQWFRSGDLMRRDATGYFYFVDRIGDTFRWKGENVSTAEVAEVVSACAGVSEVNVYGVKVGASDGRAGMASLVPGPEFNTEALYAHVEAELPGYAKPMFIRLQGEIEITGTFKHRKVELVEEGFDPSKTSDALYFLNPEEKRYTPIDEPLYARIIAGEFRI